MRRIASSGAPLVLLSLLIALSTGPITPHGAAAAPPRVLGVRAALALCRNKPATYRLQLRGWFILSGVYATGPVGGLFDSPSAVPLTTVDDWDMSQHWKRYGAIYTHINTHASFGSRRLTLHGRLDCNSASFSTDQDPFPPPKLEPTYVAPSGSRQGALSASATAGGLKLTLTVPRHAYPRNALALVTVSMQNIASHDIDYLSPGFGPPGTAVPQVQVLDSSNRIVFPPAMPYYPPLPGPGPGPVPLHPGQILTSHQYIVVRGARIRVSQQFMPKPGTTVSRAFSTLQTRPLTVTLTSEPPPAFSFHQTAVGPRIDLTAPPGVHSRPLRVEYADCSFPESYSYTNFWVPSGAHITSGCAPVRSWHLRVAWLNHPVVAVDYTAAQPTPLPSPTATPTATPSPTIAPTTPSFAQLLRRANHAMAVVESLHAEGIHTVRDLSHQPALSIHADCRSPGGPGFPIMLRVVSSPASASPAAKAHGYMIDGPVVPQPGVTTRTWGRAPATGEQWRPVDLRKQWYLDRFLSTDPVFTVNPAYTNQACPNLIRFTYLTAPLPVVTVPPRVLGLTTVNGHRVWHLREQIWVKLDLFIDTGSYRLIRLRLWDQPNPSSGWQVRFDYSRFNAPIRITSPGN